MCEQCGCSLTHERMQLSDDKGIVSSTPADPHAIAVITNILRENDELAAHNRSHLGAHGVLAINLMSSPGSGKTSLIESTIDAIGGRLRIAVIEGDIETENDAARVRAKGVPAVQITTGQTCHLDAHMVHQALHRLDLHAVDLLFIENVGNLVCPASFDLGQHANVTLLSVTEGDDKPVKYPAMFRISDLVLLAKCDLLPVLDDFDPDKARAHVRALANPAPILEVSARRPESLLRWIAWLEERRASLGELSSRNPHAMPPG
ncbi:MAG: hydrogenase nickel incorporation protein HypB [Alphaproteobacteria bacterium]|nr:hydrogenase nickel incorporation protein HypB [Alphaproteobacteria bacterium]